MKKSLMLNKWENTAAFPHQVNLNFDEVPGIVFTAKNISDSVLKGNMSSKHRFNKINIISSRLEVLNAKNVSFDNSDIKDSHIALSKFTKCNFNNASHNNNLQKDNHYIECTFSQTSITLSDFRDCVFEKCDFSNIVISDCRFFNCKFDSCKTSNKIIESSLILDCNFIFTRIEIDTILGNFGLTIDNLHECFIELKNPELKQQNIAQVKKALAQIESTTQNNIQKFRLAYFREPSILSDFAVEVDNLFIVSDWISLGQNPNRFKLHIEKLHEFLLYTFDKDQLRLRTLIQLFEISAKLSDTFARKSDFIDLQRTIDGVFLTLERILEKYLLIAESLLLECEKEGYCRILVEEGPLNIEYYAEKLKPITDIAPLKFGKIIKHNSPNELFIHWEDIKDLWPLILFLFTTSFKIELNKLDQKTKRLRNKSNILRSNQLLKIESSGLDSSNALSFRLKTLLPGHHELGLVMQFSLDRYKQLIKTIKGWLSFESKSKEKPELNES